MARLAQKPLVAMTFFMLLLGSAIGGAVAAQSTTPSAPQFSVKLQNSAIQLVIENQPFTQSADVNQLVYYYRAKDHYGQAWKLYGDFTLQSSNGESTTITVSDGFLRTGFGNSSVLDFQVQAVTGNYAVTNKSGPPPLISPAPQNWHTEITFNASETSDWSTIQTVTLPTTIATVPANPTEQPTIPELQLATVLPLLAALTAVAVVIRSKNKKRIRLTC